MENEAKLTRVQRIVLIASLLYIILPDLVIGPFDDILVAVLAGVTELGLGIARVRSG